MEAHMSNFPYNNTAEAVLAEEVGIVTEHNRKLGNVMMYFVTLKFLIVGSCLALAFLGQDLSTDAKTHILAGVTSTGIAAAIIGPLVIVGRRAIPVLLASFALAALVATLMGVIF
jgi:hypothetical protein